MIGANDYNDSADSVHSQITINIGNEVRDQTKLLGSMVGRGLQSLGRSIT